jgi:hypothetical protein
LLSFLAIAFPFNISTVGGERLSIGFYKGTISLSHLQFWFGQARDGSNYKQFAPYFLSYDEVCIFSLFFPSSVASDLAIVCVTHFVSIRLFID